MSEAPERPSPDNAAALMQCVRVAVLVRNHLRDVLVLHEAGGVAPPLWPDASG